MKIRMGQIFRVSSSVTDDDESGIIDYIALTRGCHNKGADVFKGIWGYREVVEPGTHIKRRPAIILHSNPFKEDSETNPWVDIIDPDRGYALYNGDNRTAERVATLSPGNKLLLSVYPLYCDPSLRKFAPPILVFSQCFYRGSVRGYRKFSGFGIPTKMYIRTQREKGGPGYFTNLVIELVLFGLEKEGELFDFEWIDKRRDPGLTSDEALRFAPETWKRWVREGEKVIEQVRRRVARYKITKREEQLDYSPYDADLLDKVIEYYKELNRHPFEGLASFISQRVIGGRFLRGWVTKRSGDGGVDFVSRLDIGSDFSVTSVVILGQAKCISRRGCINGNDLARIVARLQRGWIGVFVTTGYFSESAQLELHQDGYPVVLINGKRLAQELRLILNQEGISLEELLERETKWYSDNFQPLEPHRILDFDYPLTQLDTVT